MTEFGATTKKFIKIHSFEVILELNGSIVAVDYESKIVKIEWHGVVDLDTATELLEKGADMIESGYCNRLLLNRENLKEFSTEARVWIKQDLLKNRGKRLVRKVGKVATVRSSSAMGSIFANFISSGIQLVFPSLKLSNFDSENEAFDWLVESIELVG
ncbi:MAG: hypothetical protein ABJG78_12145 [Cyclobacteriaceae bacterium]